MQVTVFIYSFDLAGAVAYFRFRLVLEVYPDASGVCLHIYEGNVMFRKHGVWNASNLYLDPAFVDSRYYRNMLLIACIHCVRDKFLHLLSAADYGNF